MNNYEMVPGKTYRIKMHDCCIQGNFTAKFVRYTEPRGDFFDQAVFESATIGPDWGQWHVEEIEGVQ